MNAIMLNILTQFQTLKLDRKGQTAVEWMTIAAIFIIAVAAVFLFFGDEIQDAAQNIVDKIFGNL